MDASSKYRKSRIRRLVFVSGIAVVALVALSVPSASAAQYTFTLPGYGFTFNVQIPDRLSPIALGDLFANTAPATSVPTQSSTGSLVLLDRENLSNVPTWIPSVNRAVEARMELNSLNGLVQSYNTNKASLGGNVSAPVNSSKGVGISRLNSAQEDAQEVVQDVQAQVHELNGLTSRSKSSQSDPYIFRLISSIHTARGVIGNASGQIEAVRHARA